MSLIILAAQTAAGTSSPFYVSKYRPTQTITASGLAGSEYVDVQIKHGSVFISTGVANRLTATAPVLAITAIGDYQLVKSVTAAVCSVALG